MPDTFTITILFIIFCTIAGAFVKGRSRDKCLRDLSGYLVTLEKNNGKTVWGKLRVENSGLELIYTEPCADKDSGQTEKSYILYKGEYDQIKALVRYEDKLDPALRKRREKRLKKTSSPGLCSRFMRKVRNFSGTIRDSLLEAVSLFMGRVKSAGAANAMLKGQDKYVSKIQQQAVTGLCTSYEPVLERYVGKKVVLAVTVESGKEEYAGILKDYTTEFIEIMDTEYGAAGEDRARRADLIVPRARGMVRHSAG